MSWPYNASILDFAQGRLASLTAALHYPQPLKKHLTPHLFQTVLLPTNVYPLNCCSSKINSSQILLKTELQTGNPFPSTTELPKAGILGILDAEYHFPKPSRLRNILNK